jgi:type IV fimbrial biogenesis protein FimT
MPIKLSSTNGFTLIELLVTVAVAAIVMTVAVPSFRELVINNRTVANANSIVAALSFAKSEAVKSGLSVVIYRKGTTSQNWDAGWDIFFDTNGDGDYDAGTDTLLKTNENQPGFTLRTGNTFANSMTYLPTGLLSGNAGDTFRLCSSTDTTKSRAIVVNNVGRVYTQTGTASCP